MIHWREGRKQIKQKHRTNKKERAKPKTKQQNPKTKQKQPKQKPQTDETVSGVHWDINIAPQCKGWTLSKVAPLHSGFSLSIYFLDTKQQKFTTLLFHLKWFWRPHSCPDRRKVYKAISHLCSRCCGPSCSGLLFCPDFTWHGSLKRDPPKGNGRRPKKKGLDPWTYIPNRCLLNQRSRLDATKQDIHK